VQRAQHNQIQRALEQLNPIPGFTWHPSDLLP
jgi:hypothetical protein